MLGEALFSEARALSSELSSPMRLYIRLYYLLRVISMEVKRSLSVLEARYWRLLLELYSEEIRGGEREADRIEGELASLRSMARSYIYVGELLSMLASMMEDVEPRDLDAPWPMFMLARSIVGEARRAVGSVSAMMSVELGEISDLLDLLLAGRSSGSAGEAGEIAAKAAEMAEEEMRRLMPKPMRLSSMGVSSLA